MSVVWSFFFTVWKKTYICGYIHIRQMRHSLLIYLFQQQISLPRYILYVCCVLLEFDLHPAGVMDHTNQRHVRTVYTSYPTRIKFTLSRRPNIFAQLYFLTNQCSKQGRRNLLWCHEAVSGSQSFMLHQKEIEIKSFFTCLKSKRYK